MPLKTHLDEPPTLNLTAMLDVMFLLIIFFMLGTRFVDDERQIALRVPEVVDRGALDAAAERKTVNVYRDGTITLDQKPVTLGATRPPGWPPPAAASETSASWCAATPRASSSRSPPC